MALSPVYQALQVTESEQGKTLASVIEKDTPSLAAGELLIRVAYSSVNYKDALAVTGKGKILKSLPLVAGIDAAGVVAASRSGHWREGDQVLVTGCGIGENVDGGYGAYLKASEEWAVPMPAGLDPALAMTYGTAGFTAALCLQRMELNWQKPSGGSILVTGASGGVGSFAVAMLAKRGYEVIAVSGKADLRDWLMQLGAKEVVAPHALGLGDRPLEKARFAGAIDNVGGKLLSQIVASTGLWGNVAVVGLADSPTLNATVMPLILRGVSLLGISSNNCPRPLRLATWERMAEELRPADLPGFVSRTIALAEVGDYAEEMLARRTHGRCLVKMV